MIGSISFTDAKANCTMLLLELISQIALQSNISFLLLTIVKQYLFSSYCITVVSDEAINLNFNLSFTTIIPNDSLELLSRQLLEVSENGCSDYIVNVKNPQMFMIAFDEVSRLATVRRSDRKIIILLPHSDNDEYFGLLSMKESSFVANILIISKNNDSEMNCDVYDLVTHEFIKTEGDLPIFLDRWNSCTQKFEQNTNLFPHDIRDLKGKTMKTACFTYKPYIFLDLDTAIEPLGRDGMEMRIVDEFCRWLNCTVEIVDEEEGQWGEIYENRTGIGVLGSVVEDRADIGISALYSWYEEFLYLDFSAAGIRSAVTAVAPSPRLLSSRDMPLMPFSLYMWYAVLLTFVYSCICLFLAKGCSSDKVLLTVFGIIISQSQHLGSSWRVRGVTGWLLGASLVLVSAYGAGLATTFTVPKYEKSIDTIQDLVDRKMEWGATHDAWIFSITLSEEPLIKQLVSQFRIYSEKELKRRSFTRSMAFSIEKLPAGYFAIGDYITKEALLDMTVMLEKFYYELCVVMLRKSSPYTEKMSELIGRLHQSGLMLAWETQVALKYLNFEVQLEMKLSRSKNDNIENKALNFGNVVGIFIIFFFGVILSVFVFICELVCCKIMKKLEVPL